MQREKHSFSVEMNSKDHVKTITVSDNPRGKVVFEAELGVLQTIEFIEGLMLKLAGEKGTIRIDLTEGELTTQLAKPSQHNLLV